MQLSYGFVHSSLLMLLYVYRCLICVHRDRSYGATGPKYWDGMGEKCQPTRPTGLLVHGVREGAKFIGTGGGCDDEGARTFPKKNPMVQILFRPKKTKGQGLFC